ncbi:MAG: hypothetical protein UIH41_03615 [Treponemataceae bacterium]|nr:hypothetical protein [Treponemataceae bacterium]
MNQEAVCWLKNEIKKRYGNVKRARGIYLYTEKGVRLTDCYLDGGRGILGHGGGKAKTAFKDCFERGANGFYDSGLLPAFEKSVKKLLPAEYTEIRLYSEKTAAMLGETSLSLDGASDKTYPVLWRPWLDFAGKITEQPTGYPKIEVVYNVTGAFPAIVKIVPPFTYATDISVYAFSKACGEEMLQNLPENDVVPSPLLAAYTRGFYDLLNSFSLFTEKDFKANSKALEPFFTRNQCYLFPKIPETQYKDFVLKCLEAGIVISPDYNVPSIIPWRANPGDIKKISKINLEG